ncbi:MAG: pilus assembly protein N-terminal domain-containing protein [Planctomycetota bacterium]
MRTYVGRTLVRRVRCRATHIALAACAIAIASAALAQTDTPPDDLDSPETQAKVDSLIDNVRLPEARLVVDPRRSKLITTKKPVSRFSITNPEIADIVQFGPTEFELIGSGLGETTLTLWFGQGEVLRYLVEVKRDVQVEHQREEEYADLQRMVNELFPDSSIQLFPIADKVIVRGQARDAVEVTRIISIITESAAIQNIQAGFGQLATLGNVAAAHPGSNLPASRVINMLEVPGEMQVMLRVRVAELSRSALREMGADLNINAGDFKWTQLLGVAGAFNAVLTTEEVKFALSAISSNSYSKILAEPNLVTLSGRTASFIAGGEFAVPIVVGVEGAAAATTNFRGFGTQVNFTPTVIDKDRIRLQVAPSVSALDAGAAVNGIPGLKTRAVFTTVDLREGQWLAIAGLIQDEQQGSKARVPFVGDIPILDAIFSKKSVKRDETELLILVSPELVHPLSAEEAPLILPGMEVTEPNDLHFFVYGDYEGDPNCHHRSTVWNLQHRRSLLQGSNSARYQASEDYYFHGAHGFSP